MAYSHAQQNSYELYGLVISSPCNKQVAADCLTALDILDVRLDFQSNPLRIAHAIDSDIFDFVMIMDCPDLNNIKFVVEKLSQNNKLLPIFALGSNFEKEVAWEQLQTVHFLMNTITNDDFITVFSQALVSIFPNHIASIDYSPIEIEENMDPSSFEDRRKGARDITKRLMVILSQKHKTPGFEYLGIEVVVVDPEVHNLGLTSDALTFFEHALDEAVKELEVFGHLEIVINTNDGAIEICIRSKDWVEIPPGMPIECDVNTANSMRYISNHLLALGYGRDSFSVRQSSSDKWGLYLNF